MGETSVLNDIKRGVISLVYLFYGSERLMLEEALERLTKYLTPGGTGDFNYEKFDAGGASVAQVVNAANLLPIFAEKRLVVVTGAPWFSGNKKRKSNEEEGQKDEKDEVEPDNQDGELLLTYLKNPSPSTCLVFIAGEKIDGKRKTVKAIKKTGQVIEFTAFKGMELNKWVNHIFSKNGNKITRGAIDYLIMAAGNNMSLLEQEIEKIGLFVGSSKEVTLDHVKQTVSENSTLNVFSLVDGISQKDASSAVFKLRELIQNGEIPIKIIGLIAWQIRNLLHIKSLKNKGLGENQIAADSGLNPYVVKKGLRTIGNFSTQELINDLEILLAVDVNYKTGKGEIIPLLETAIIKMCR